eukprot:scaffold1187_cov374-Prasinococcus_capsulatus_cf.AAC.3
MSSKASRHKRDCEHAPSDIQGESQPARRQVSQMAYPRERFRPFNATRLFDPQKCLVYVAFPTKASLD